LSTKEIARLVLASEPCRTLLSGIERLPLGRQALNRISQGRGVYLTFEEAWKAAKRGVHGGHDTPEAIKLHVELSKGLRSSDYAVLFWLSLLCAERYQIFDFGGNAGNLYYSYLPYLRERAKSIEWAVFDLPTIIDEGRRIAAEQRSKQLRFADSVAEVSEDHVLLVSGALHYWEKSVHAFLEQFPRRPSHILVNRTPVHDKESSFITVQRTSSYAVPCIVRSASEMIADFSSMGYTMIDRWPCLELSLKLPLYPDRSFPHYSGFYFRRD
jgi:putative methyltransferase (TIGR04325 family)